MSWFGDGDLECQPRFCYVWSFFFFLNASNSKSLLWQMVQIWKKMSRSETKLTIWDRSDAFCDICWTTDTLPLTCDISRSNSSRSRSRSSKLLQHICWTINDTLPLTCARSPQKMARESAGRENLVWKKSFRTKVAIEIEIIEIYRECLSPQWISIKDQEGTLAVSF